MSTRYVERDDNRSGVIDDEGTSSPPASKGRSTALATWRRAMLAVAGAAGLVAVVGDVSTEQAGAASSATASCSSCRRQPDRGGAQHRSGAERRRVARPAGRRGDFRLTGPASGYAQPEGDT